MFGGFWATVFLAPLATFVLASPVFYMARKTGRKDTIRSFAIGGAVVVLFIATLAYVSEVQVEQCLEAGNPNCLDAGTPGLQLVILGAYVVASWWVAWSISDH